MEIGFKDYFFCYLPNTKFTWNKLKFKILDNSNYVNFHGGGDFSLAYVMMCQYFGKKTITVKNEYIRFYKQLDIFFVCLFPTHVDTWDHKFF